MEEFLETERLELRAPSSSDLGDWQTVSNATAEQLRECLVKSISEFAMLGHGIGTVIDKESGEFVGRAGLKFNEDLQTFEMICDVSIRKRNSGLGKELIIKLIDWAFQNLPITHLIAHAAFDSSSSHFVLERSGMKRIEELTASGEPSVLFGIRRNEWIPQRARRLQQKYDSLRSSMLIGA